MEDMSFRGHRDRRLSGVLSLLKKSNPLRSYRPFKSSEREILGYNYHATHNHLKNGAFYNHQLYDYPLRSTIFFKEPKPKSHKVCEFS